MAKLQDMLKQILLAQGQPSAPAVAPPAELRQRIQDLEEHKARMAEQLAEVQALVEKQDQLAAAQHTKYERSKKNIFKDRVEDNETITQQRKEIGELKAKLQETVPAAQSVYATPPKTKYSALDWPEAAQQPAVVAQWVPTVPTFFCSASPTDKEAEEQEKEKEEAAASADTK
jgi:predicted nuclease with TOPRIM domain